MAARRKVTSVVAEPLDTTTLDDLASTGAIAAQVEVLERKGVLTRQELPGAMVVRSPRTYGCTPDTCVGADLLEVG